VKRPLHLISAVALVVLAACNGSNDAIESTTSRADSSTTELGSVTTPSVDQASTTTSAPSETTTASTVESTIPVDTTETAVADGLIASRDAYLYAVYNLDAVDALDRLNSTHAAGGPSLALALDNIQTLVDNGWLARPNPDVPDTVTIESDVTMLNDTTAELTACVVGAGEVYAPGAGDGGADLLVNGEIEAALNRVTMVLEDGRWKLQSGTNISTEAGTACVAA
jgi:hypothetical protein